MISTSYKLDIHSVECYNPVMGWLSNGDCALCGRHRELVQDHDHDTGKLRSKLCIACNSGLGMFQDDPEMLIKASEYLHFWKKVPAKSRPQRGKVSTAANVFRRLSLEEQERILKGAQH